jgi:succinate dehydrogenase / fumarate reductase cytochrome b subunit
MASQNRPLSPHLQIYRPQWTSVLSITHRATGVALAVGTLYLVWWLAAAAGGPESYASFQSFAGSFLGQLILFGWTVCLFYHLANGIRHMVWDTGHWLELDQAYKSGIGVLVATGALTVVAWIWGWFAWGGG